MSAECLFCGVVTGNVPHARVTEDDSTYAFMDRNPGTDGHLLVIPKRHSNDLLEIAAEDLTAVTLTAQRIAKAVIGTLGADGVNLLNCCGAEAWQSVFHFHLHVIPRYTDTDRDPLVPPWKPGVPGDMEAITARGAQLAAALD
ncbi:HIT family protein [Sciscionella marina]|uniref:HIT family protein n=1 Tax=Sciscionella marina TaxID=508770 RepID=UPI00037F9453|nr:HIT domain-containing protein [Sciscionella marina]